ncbi:MAG: nitrous oxide-stimulated promoter family protein [Candidatus Sumerlaeia bacterium]
MNEPDGPNIGGKMPGARRGRIAREKRTVAAMMRLYCRVHRHARPPGQNLCPDCAALLEYSHRRLDACVYGDAKPTCAQCPVHCYKPAMRERMREMMRFAGPRMVWRHPWLALRHLLDERLSPSPPPPPPRKKTTGFTPQPLSTNHNQEPQSVNSAKD